MILSTHLFCLLNLSTTPQLCPPFLLAYTFDVLDIIRQHNQPNTICYLLCVIYYTLCAIHYALCTMHYILFTIHYALCIIHYALCTMYYSLCTMHYVLFTMHYYALFSMQYALCIRICTYSYVFTILYIFIRIHYFTWKSGEIP